MLNTFELSLDCLYGPQIYSQLLTRAIHWYSYNIDTMIILYFRSEYVKHPMPDKPVKEPAQYIPNKAALDDVSNYKKDYVAKQVS